jgi:hypothetical protein
MRLPSHDFGLPDIAARWHLLVYPRLREFPAAARDEALRVARAAEFDTVERIGILGGVVATAAVLQTLGADWDSSFVRYLAQFVLAVPLLGMVIGPLLLRRTRRALDIECQKWKHGEKCSEA